MCTTNTFEMEIFDSLLSTKVDAQFVAQSRWAHLPIHICMSVLLMCKRAK